MLTPGIDGYAMGWEAGEIDGVDDVSHEGSFLSLIMVIADRGVALVVLTNSEEAAEGLAADAPALFIASAE